MFWKKDKAGAAVAAGTEAQKPKKATPKDLLTEQINAVEPGKELTYRLGEIYVKPYITIVRNTEGKKFTVYQDSKDAAGNPSGNRGKFWDTNEAKEISGWIIEREGTVYKG